MLKIQDLEVIELLTILLHLTSKLKTLRIFQQLRTETQEFLLSEVQLHHLRIKHTSNLQVLVNTTKRAQMPKML